MSRMFVQEVMAENARLFSVRHTRAIVLQRWWRWCRAFRRVERMKYAQIAPEIMKVYKHHRFKQREALEDKHMHMKVKAHYKHEIKQARGAFFTGGFALRCVVLRGVACFVVFVLLLPWLCLGSQLGELLLSTLHMRTWTHAWLTLALCVVPHAVWQCSLRISCEAS